MGIIKKIKDLFKRKEEVKEERKEEAKVEKKHITKCEYCNKKFSNLTDKFHCKYCKEYNCGKHMLPEGHKCVGLIDLKKSYKWLKEVK